MPLGLGTPEILIILAIALLILGPTKLPQLARALGQSIREFRKASTGVLEEEEKRAIRDMHTSKEDINRDLLETIARKLDVSVENKGDKELLEEIIKKAKEKGLIEDKSS